jgi:hypothetical protein
MYIETDVLLIGFIHSFGVPVINPITATVKNKQVLKNESE